MNFTARRISLEHDPDAIAGDLVYRREDVARLSDIAQVVDRARRAASQVMRDARRTAKINAARSAAARRAQQRDADRAFLARAAALEEAYRQAQISLTGQLEATLDRVFAAALACISVELSAEQRLRAVCEQLAKVAGPIAAARLCVCAADASLCHAGQIDIAWPLQIDDALSPGHCRLVTDNGEWTLDFDALIAALQPISASIGSNEYTTD